MEKEKIVAAVTELATGELGEVPGYFVVAVRLSPTNQLKVFVDADEGASIDRLAKLNRALYRKIEEAGLFGTATFSLEVSSPGLDEPLKLTRQYRKNIGRRVEVSLADDSHLVGVLRGVTEEALTLEHETGPKKNRQTEQVEIPFNQIKFTKVCVVF